MKVWLTDVGAYANNCIDGVFSSEEAAQAYVDHRNAEAAKEAEKSGYRSMNSYWSVTGDYEVDEKCQGIINALDA